MSVKEVQHKLADLRSEYRAILESDGKNIARSMDLEEWLTYRIMQIIDNAKFWEDAHAKLEEKLRIQYDAEFEAFKVSFENRIRDEYEQKLNEAAHADASEITSLRKELDKRDESIKNLLRINETLNTVIKKISTGQIHDPSVYNDGLRANEIDLNSGQNVSFREEPRNSGWSV
jgi:hypothetical protein